MVTGSEEFFALRITLAVFGTRGTVFPMLAVGRALVERGHSVTFAAPDRFREDAIGAGMLHHTLRPDPLLALEEANRSGQGGSTELGLRGVVFPKIEETYRDLLAAGRDAQILVFPMFIFPGPMAAERLGLPWVEVHYTPGTLNSIYDPPFLPPVPWLYPWARRSSLVTRMFNPLAKLGIHSWYAPLRELRAREGFAALKGSPLLGGMRSPWMTLALFSSRFGAVQKDWPQPNVVTGFPFYDEPPGQDPRLEEFLQAGDAPIVVSLGSTVSGERLAFFQACRAAAQKVGRRLLLVAGPDTDALNAHGLQASSMAVSYAPYSQVFPKACVNIVSGSTGALAHALRAGKPMLVVAAETAADHPDNALRAERMGVGRWTMLSKFNADTATEHLRQLFSDVGYARSAASAGEAIRAEDGLTSACKAIEAVLSARVATAGMP